MSHAPRKTYSFLHVFLCQGCHWFKCMDGLMTCSTHFLNNAFYSIKGFVDLTTSNGLWTVKYCPFAISIHSLNRVLRYVDLFHNFTRKLTNGRRIVYSFPFHTCIYLPVSQFIMWLFYSTYYFTIIFNWYEKYRFRLQNCFGLLSVKVYIKENANYVTCYSTVK